MSRPCRQAYRAVRGVSLRFDTHTLYYLPDEVMQAAWKQAAEHTKRAAGESGI